MDDINKRTKYFLEELMKVVDKSKLTEGSVPFFKKEFLEITGISHDEFTVLCAKIGSHVCRAQAFKVYGKEQYVINMKECQCLFEEYKIKKPDAKTKLISELFSLREKISKTYQN